MPLQALLQVCTLPPSTDQQKRHGSGESAGIQRTGSANLMPASNLSAMTVCYLLRDKTAIYNPTGEKLIEILNSLGKVKHPDHLLQAPLACLLSATYHNSGRCLISRKSRPHIFGGIARLCLLLAFAAHISKAGREYQLLYVSTSNAG